MQLSEPWVVQYYNDLCTPAAGPLFNYGRILTVNFPILRPNGNKRPVLKLGQYLATAPDDFFLHLDILPSKKV